MLKAHDLLVFYRLLEHECSPETTIQKIAQTLGLSPSQVFDSLERSVEMGIVQKDRRTVRRERLADLLTHALPYVIPGKLGGTGTGLALASDTIELVPSGSTAPLHEPKWIWAADDVAPLSKGVCVEPLDRRVPAIAAREPHFHRYFSQLEVLRFADHPTRPWAAEQIRAAVMSLGRAPAAPGPGAAHAPSDLVDSILDAAAQVSTRQGFRHTRIADVARAAGIEEGAIRAIFPDEHALFQETIFRCMRTAGQFIGRLLIMPAPAKESELENVLTTFMEYLERNEAYFRMMLWQYLETDVPSNAATAEAFRMFVLQIGEAMARASGAKWTEEEKIARGYAYVSVPNWYGFAFWGETPRFADPGLRARVRAHLKDLILREVLPVMVRPASPRSAGAAPRPSGSWS